MHSHVFFMCLKAFQTYCKLCSLFSYIGMLEKVNLVQQVFTLLSRYSHIMRLFLIGPSVVCSTILLSVCPFVKVFSWNRIIYFFSKFWHGTRNPCGVVCHPAGCYENTFARKMGKIGFWLGENGENRFSGSVL